MQRRAVAGGALSASLPPPELRAAPPARPQGLKRCLCTQHNSPCGRRICRHLSRRRYKRGGRALPLTVSPPSLPPSLSPFLPHTPPQQPWPASPPSCSPSCWCAAPPAPGAPPARPWPPACAAGQPCGPALPAQAAQPWPRFKRRSPCLTPLPPPHPPALPSSTQCAGS